jgi:hypothetical protein
MPDEIRAAVRTNHRQVVVTLRAIDRIAQIATVRGGSIAQS